MIGVESILQHLAALVDVPALLLALFVVTGLLMAWRAQRGGKVDFGNMLRDETGKESAMRFGVLVAVLGSNWVLMKAALQNSEHLPQLYWAFLIAWSASPALRELAAKWNGVLPWSKP